MLQSKTCVNARCGDVGSCPLLEQQAEETSAVSAGVSCVGVRSAEVPNSSVSRSDDRNFLYSSEIGNFPPSVSQNSAAAVCTESTCSPSRANDRIFPSSAESGDFPTSSAIDMGSIARALDLRT